ncbi:MAG TPA: uracil-DNA glycosylase family protein [Allosphingosinicella sp.]|nr:uracil-DNA glycosylase family protein [Allosphingosinicella sp.]
MSSDWAASALAWWHEAGVDTLVDEAPRDWLNPRPAAAPARVEAAPREAPPADLAAFQAWLLSSDGLPGASGGGTRVGPAGDPAAGLMVMVDMPSAEDVAAGTLLSGEPGRLFDRMLGAIGRGRDTLYLASLSPIRFPTGQLDGDDTATLAEIARHHVGLVAPAALLLFGDACAKALLGCTVPRARARWHELATPTGPVRTLATIRPEKLIGQPNLKKHAWEDLQLLREGLKG